MEITDPKLIRSKLMDYLARREHSDFELKAKLRRKVESIQELEKQIEKLKEEGLIDNFRFSEAYIKSRSSRGFGPTRITQELNQRGVSEETFIEILDSNDWIGLARSALLKKAKGKDLKDKKTEIKIKQFLNYRGFNFIQIDKAFESVKGNEIVDGQSWKGLYDYRVFILCLIKF